MISTKCVPERKSKNDIHNMYTNKNFKGKYESYSKGTC